MKIQTSHNEGKPELSILEPASPGELRTPSTDHHQQEFSPSPAAPWVGGREQ